MDELPLADYQSVCDAFGEDVYEAISLESCINRRLTKGAPGAMDEAVKAARKYLEA
jgi:argininosuccinate lyase